MGKILASEASVPRKYSEEIDFIWSSVGNLAKRLQQRDNDNRSSLDSSLNKLMAETRDHLKKGNDCIDWERTAGTKVIPELRRSLGMTGMSLSLGVWVVIGVCIAILGERLINTTFGIVVGIIGTFALAAWLKKIQLGTLLPKLKTRLMYFNRKNDGAEFPYDYNTLVVDESTLNLNSIIDTFSFINITHLGIEKAYGVFGPNNSVIAFVPILSSGGLVNILGRDEFTLESPVFRPGIEKYEKRQGELLDQWGHLEAQINNRSISCIDIEESRKKWENVVVAPDTFEHILRSWILFAYGDKSAPKGILLKGSPGTGKSLIASLFSETSGAHFFKLSVGDLKGEHIGESGNNVRRIWEEARENQPSIIFVDECEGVFVKRGSDQGDTFTNELVQTFLTEWDGIGPDAHVLVIGATNRADLIDDAVMSRFTDVIDLQPVGKEHRAPLIQAVARQIGMDCKIPSEVMEQMGGLSGRDLRNVLQQALRLAAPDEPRLEHFSTALLKIRGKGNTKTDIGAKWESLVLAEETKQRLKITCHMVKDSEALIASGIPVPRALLLYGPPGTGKTQIARTIANEAGISFIARTTTDFKGQYLGQAAARISQIFETARAQSPSILFIDEIDALTSNRQGGSEDQLQREALTQLLQEMDGIAEKSGFVLVVAATNCLEHIDSAILSRFNQKIEIGLPNAQQRTQLLHVLLANRPVASDINLAQLASRCDGLSGRDLREMVTEAFNTAVERVFASGKSASQAILQAEDLENVVAKRSRL